MKLIVDGKEVKFDYQVKVIYEDELLDCDGKTGDVHMILSDEGLIVDLYQADNNTEDCDRTMTWDLEYFIEETL